jgi:hypothetical protein
MHVSLSEDDLEMVACWPSHLVAAFVAASAVAAAVIVAADEWEREFPW